MGIRTSRPTAAVQLAQEQLQKLLESNIDHIDILIYLQKYIQPLNERDLIESDYCRVFSIATVLVKADSQEIRRHRLEQLQRLLKGECVGD